MAVKRRLDYTDLLVKKGIVSPDQLEEAKQLAAQSGMKLPDALVRLGYATGEDVMQVMAEQHGLEYVDLSRISIPPNVVELVPESVARENVVIPLAEDDGQLRVAVCDADDFATFDKLRFILNRRIEICLAPREAILEAINRYYGQTSGESQDSVLSEVTDTAIDFTQVETDMGSIQDADENSAPVVRLVHLSSQRLCNCGRRISILSRLKTVCESAIGSTATWLSGITPPDDSWGRFSLVSRFWPGWTLPNAAGRKTGESR